MPRHNNGRLLLDSRPIFLDRVKGPRSKGIQKKWDGDVIMADGDQGPSSQQSGHLGNRSKKFDRRQIRKGGKNKWSKGEGRGKAGERASHSYGPEWHKVLIYDGASMNKENVLTVMMNALRNKNILLQPIAYTVNEPNSMFYVESRTVAEALGSQAFESIRFRIIHIGTPPTAPFTPALEERLSTELKSRLSQTGHLDLSNFHSTTSVAVDNFLPLYRLSVGTLLGKLMKDWLGLVSSVDVSFNKLLNTDCIAFLNNGINITTVKATDNKLRDINALDSLKLNKLLDLNLSNNPLCDKYKDRSKYEQDLKRKFPSLLKLDNRELDASSFINFDIESSAVPNPKKSWYCNESAQAVVRTFVSEYIRLYDSSRGDLTNAYSELAVMTLSSSYIKDSSLSSSFSHPNHHTKLSDYIGESRNILNRGKPSQKRQLVHVGREEIIRFLKKLPPTQHIDYVIDMPVALEAFIVFTVQGMFREPASKHVVRHFTRSFTLVPCNNGFVIVNEMLFVTNPTPAQTKSLQHAKPHFGLEMGSSAEATSLPTNPKTMEEKLRVFIEQSRMNQDWARKCLEENAWDFDRAVYVFTELSKAGKIPPEAFQVPPVLGS